MQLKPVFSFFFLSSRKLPVSGSGSVKSLTGCFYSCCDSERLNSSCFLSHMHFLRRLQQRPSIALHADVTEKAELLKVALKIASERNVLSSNPCMYYGFIQL